MTRWSIVRRAIAAQALLYTGMVAHAQTAPGCASLPHGDHPHMRLRRGPMTAVVFLPDAVNGYYRGSRFDWSGIVGCVSLNGHTFFGEWFKHYEPTINDAVTGPAEEFRRSTSELGYDEAGPDGTFLKIGVGVLRRVDDAPYRFGGDYPIVDHGVWTVTRSRHAITFRQVLRSSFGYAYTYEKKLSLDADGTVLTFTHRLQNNGSKPIDTAMYNHDFFMFDGRPIGPGVTVHLPFIPVPDTPLPAVAQIDGTTVRITGPLQAGHGIGTYITGFSSSPSQFDFVVEDAVAGMGVEESADSSLARMYLWATPTTICPEGYIALNIAPGQSRSWAVRYRFRASGKGGTPTPP